MRADVQKILSADQVAAFYHDEFVESQVVAFRDLVLGVGALPGVVVDVGGGCGYFADALSRTTGTPVRVVDLDPVSVAECRAKGIDAQVGNALQPDARGDEAVVCFNLILHHLVAADEAATIRLQQQALACWAGRPVRLFVNEYIYDSYIGTVSGRMIYAITSSQFLSTIAAMVARVVPSLRANTFGIGVRFRAHQEWIAIFRSLGLEVVAYQRGEEEGVSLARRMLLIRSCRRDSYLLQEAEYSED